MLLSRKWCQFAIRQRGVLSRCCSINNASLAPSYRLHKALSIDSCLESSKVNHKPKLFYLAAAAGVLLGAAINMESDVQAAVAITQKPTLVQADELYAKNNYADLYKMLLIHKDSNDDELLWRLARTTYDLAKEAEKSSQKADLLKEALTYAERALAINEENFAVHKWMAILVNEVASLTGTKEKILKSFVIKDHMERACELNPKDGTSWHILGTWHFNVAMVTWYERKAASLIFATPPESSYDEALRIFLHAESVEPNFYSQNLLMIAKCYLKLNRKEEAMQYLRKTTNYRNPYSPPTRDDMSSAVEAQALLAQHGEK